ncbi:MAG: hypothetical protein LLG20_07665 [Acidobacteriales bacterium]|nr:hypothetical protein [Terriglobales bacterium]
MEQCALLHNMSAPPKAAIEHKGPRLPFRIVAFRLPNVDFNAPALLTLLDGAEWTGTPEQAECELRRRLNEHAAILPYPAALLVTDKAGDGAECFTDLLTVCTVLAKSSHRVYLRDKEPNLSNLRAGSAVALQFPAPEGKQ